MRFVLYITLFFISQLAWPQVKTGGGGGHIENALSEEELKKLYHMQVNQLIKVVKRNWINCKTNSTASFNNMLDFAVEVYLKEVTESQVFKGRMPAEETVNCNNEVLKFKNQLDCILDKKALAILRTFFTGNMDNEYNTTQFFIDEYGLTKREAMDLKVLYFKIIYGN